MSQLEQLDASALSAIDQGGALWHAYRRAVSDSLYFAVKSVFSMRPIERNLITPRMHMPLALTLQAVNEGQISRLLVSDPRRHMKSTFATVGRPVHKLCQLVVAGLDPDLRFAIRSESALNSSRFWGEIQTLFERNAFFQHLFPELIPDFTNTTWNNYSGEIPRANVTKEPSFDCLGGGPAASRHYDDITEDDYITENNYKSATCVETAIENHRQSENLLEDGDGVIVTVGNFWSMFDLNNHICVNEPGTAVFNRSSVSGPVLDGKWATRGLPESVMELLRAFPQGEPLWPERFDREALGRLMTALGPRVFLAHYANNPIDPESTEFRPEWLKKCDLAWHGSGDDREPMIVYEDDAVPMPLADCNVYLTWDPGTDQKTARSRNAVLVGAIDPFGRISVLKEHVKKQNPLATVDVFLAFAWMYRGYLREAGIEQEVFAKVLADIVQQKIRELRAKGRELYLNIRRLKVPRNLSGKDARIKMWLGTYLEEGKVYAREECVEFRGEYATFGIEDALRDALDAFAHMTRLFQRPKTRAARVMAIEREERVLEDRGICGYGSALLLPGKETVTARAQRSGARLPVRVTGSRLAQRIAERAVLKGAR